MHILTLITSEADFTIGNVLTLGSLGSELRALRELRGISQTNLAAQAGLAAPQLSQIESGRYIPSLKKLIRLLEALGAHLIIEAND